MIINGKRLLGLQTFKEKYKDDYLLVDLSSSKHHPQGHLESLCAAIDSQASSLCISSVSAEFLEKQCTEVSWKKVPKQWQNQFLERLDFPEKVIKNSKPKNDDPKQLKLF